MIAEALTAATLVTMPGTAFTPAHATVLTGEQVTWRNDDNVTHVVRADDRSFESPRMAPGATYTRTFQKPGSYRYVCILHRFMRGTIEVAGLALAAPAAPVAAGRDAALAGRAPEPGSRVVLERLGTGDVAETTAGPDGRFSFTVRADAPARYRARAGALVSPAAAVAVAPEVRLDARRVGHGVRVRIQVTPAQPRARVMLERHERERFGFVALAPVRLDAGSRATLVLHTARRLRMRVRLAGPVAGFARAVSPVTVVPRRGASRVGGAHHH